MRVALIAPLMEAVPPKAYGGTERVVASLANALSSKGHEVTVFANAESRINADLVVCRDRSLLTDDRLSESVTDHILMLDRVRRIADRFDILHFHTEFLHFPMFEEIASNTVTTCHSRLDYVGHSRFFQRFRKFPLVSISNAQRNPLPHANWAATIHHGYPRDMFRYLLGKTGNGSGGYLAFVGRIAPDKGIDTAIEIARRAGLPLKIAARINSFDKPYWEEAIRPHVDGRQIEYVGEIGEAQKSEFLGRAKALLFPIRWPEPFGLVMIEAMACGTPVIAYPCGSVPEVIEDGVTGRIVETADEALSAIADVEHLDRTKIRRQFEQRFSSDRMADAYLDVYRNLRSSRKNVDRQGPVREMLSGEGSPLIRHPSPGLPLHPDPAKALAHKS